VTVVDDDRDTADSLVLLMRMWGHDAHAAYQAASAFEEAAANPPDVMMLDIGMPRMNGYELARRLKKIPALKETVFVAVTGFADDRHRRRSAQAGFARFLVKPVDPAELESLLIHLQGDVRLAQRLGELAHRDTKLDVARRDTKLVPDNKANPT
jgi:CheY-like chemotaxis protein